MKHELVKDVRMTWHDEYGTDLAYAAGFEVPISKIVDDDKVLSVLKRK